ncbi:MAG: DUF4422 domain-containing protein [Ruminococcaceae bacterium]|nr:DUF4422 domain-containing protein [Oscillospiraceae bacterium]
MNIKILIATHKSYWMPENQMYLPIQVGAGGFQYGMKEALRRGYRYLWLMDDDVYPEPESLEALG